VVHQQDIQAFVNAVWAAGAEAVSLQGERLISTTGHQVRRQHSAPARCAVLTALRHRGRRGSQRDVRKARRLRQDHVYREYVEAYQLGLQVELPDSELTIPAYDGSPQLEHARAVTG
jgi:hypothetical protein